MATSLATVTEGTEEGRMQRVRRHTAHSDLTLILEITFIGNQDDWEMILVLYSQDLPVKRGYFIKRLPGANRVDEQKSLARAHVLLPHGPTNPETSDQHLLKGLERRRRMESGK